MSSYDNLEIISGRGHPSFKFFFFLQRLIII
jgi:hypothetical protein